MQGIAQLVLHLRHRQQQATGLVFAIDGDRARQVAFGDLFGGVQGVGDGFGDAIGQQPGEQDGQAGGNHQQGDHQVEGRFVLIDSLLVGVEGLLGVDLQQRAQHPIDGFGVTQQIGVEQAAQFVDLIVARQGLHPVFDLAVLAEQLHVLIVGRTFLRAADQLFVGGLGGADLLVAHLQQLHGFLLHVWLAVDQ
ncbi:hypothetical protein D3C84_387020 [compost metagenome]